MKKLSLLFAALAVIFIGCDGGTYEEPKSPVAPPTSGTAADINGVVWATANVDALGTFAAAPEAVGKLYQWGRNVAWSTVDPLASQPTGESWDWQYDPENPDEIRIWTDDRNPCPEGWRPPTRQEAESLLKTSFKWGTLNGVRGASFTDKSNGNSIFLPASPIRYDGILNPNENVGSFSIYWTSTEYVREEWSGMYFVYKFTIFGAEDISTDSTDSALNSSCGIPIRCVKK